MPILPKHRTQFSNAAEREIFERATSSNFFNNSSKYFFHSLRSHNVKNKIVGEIDFVYLDEQYIIFLESKGGNVKYDSVKDEWLVLSGTKKGDPFAQVTGYLFYVRNKLFPKYFPGEDYEKKLIFGYGVMFPDIEKKLSFKKKQVQSRDFKHETIEYDPEIIYCIDDHEDKEQGLIKYLEHLKRYWREHDKYFETKIPFGIGQNGVDSIRKFFRKDLVFEIPMSRLTDSEQSSIEQFTQEQFGVLDTHDLIKNKGLLVLGGPGTGKTVLSLELLLRKQREGLKCAYFCFNKNLAGKVRDYFKKAELDETIHVHSIHTFLFNSLKRAGHLPNDTQKDSSYWNNVLPQQFKLFRESLELINYDYIIIDEAQDVFCEPLITSILANLNGGIESGNWAVFVDYAYQQFYGGFDSEYFRFFINTYPCNQQMLALNCRNHTDIVKAASLHSGLPLMPCRRTKVPIKTKTQFYEGNDDFLKKLKVVSEGLISDGVNLSQITILTLNNTNLEFVAKNLDLPIFEVNDSFYKKDGKVGISTIHAFKGLENDFILIAGVDVYDSKNKESMSLLYVGYSRATIGLTILFSNNCEEELTMALLEKELKDE